MPTRQDALRLLLEHTRSPSYLKHALAAEAAMLRYAKTFNKDEAETELWAIAGLLHDFDYEQNPLPVAPHGHPYVGNKILKLQGYPPEVLEAIMAHAPHTKTPRVSQLDQALFAVVELVDLVLASAITHPRGLVGLTARHVTQRYDDRKFLPNCDRDQIRTGHQELGLSLEEHIDNVIEALQPIAAKLGFEGGETNSPTDGKYRVGG